MSAFVRSVEFVLVEPEHVAVERNSGDMSKALQGGQDITTHLGIEYR